MVEIESATLGGLITNLIAWNMRGSLGSMGANANLDGTLSAISLADLLSAVRADHPGSGV